MIKIDEISVWGFHHAMRGMRNPMNSWDKADTVFTVDNERIYKLGEADKKLMIKLAEAGPEHRKYMRQLFVSADITGPLYWWKEFDTYKIGTVANSCSTMHKLMSKPFELNDFSYDQMNNDGIRALEHVIGFLNLEREYYLNGINGQLIKDKQFWWNIIQLLPSSYNQKRTVTLDYEVLINMYKQRSHHKLDEWLQFCEWMKDLDYMSLFIE